MEPAGPTTGRLKQVRFSDRRSSLKPPQLTVVDRRWGRLFEDNGIPTQRLDQFLRGLANHIIGDFTPKKSTVVTPAKMAAYYAQHPVDKEPYPLHLIFSTQENVEISRLYQILECQHHLVQGRSSQSPVVPALTPAGFAHWITLNILAYPEEESQRLEKVVSALPIDADGVLIDGKPERLPKQISRRLLPGKEDRRSKRLLDKAIRDIFGDPNAGHRYSPDPSVEIYHAQTVSPTLKATHKRDAGGSATSGNSHVRREEIIRPYKNSKPYVTESGHHRPRSSPAQNYMISPHPQTRRAGSRQESSRQREIWNSYHEGQCSSYPKGGSVSAALTGREGRDPPTRDGFQQERNGIGYARRRNWELGEDADML